jgi:peptidoglycan hydrolase CwlO-like protein
MLKWTMESVWAATAVVITAAGGVYQMGHTAQQIADLHTQNDQTAAHVAKHDDQLTSIQQNQAGMKQSLDDIKDTVHDIQTQVRKPKHGDNQ